jgi:hypothetical protein
MLGLALRCCGATMLQELGEARGPRQVVGGLQCSGRNDCDGYSPGHEVVQL